ncbi:hypothetical protein FZC78_19060 [Rossellomorea vietnamensis]|uniref:Uncharacterized protein n=1 Tax=Rossellomorea vietnamensis TaxID=218284 RepID=A0A5D4NJL7_9BACI|nr:hypothetical protein [Rossellomorea vietnamensis]TYS14257.1 hypothetical protein FZC78_19060 [Rossellomorea vietnamensis]
MDWVSFGTGVMSTIFLFAMWPDNEEAGEAEEVMDQEEDVEINDFSVRHVTLSCQTCRKLKRHKEVSPNLYQCVKCKRHVDLRVS